MAQCHLHQGQLKRSGSGVLKTCILSQKCFNAQVEHAGKWWLTEDIQQDLVGSIHVNDCNELGKCRSEKNKSQSNLSSTIKGFWKSVASSLKIFARHESKQMNTSKLLFLLCSACSWPCCTGRESLFSPISASRFCTPEIFVSEEAVCHLPLCSALHDMKLSTGAEWSAFTIRACFQNRKQAVIAADIFLYLKLWKNKGLIHMQNPPAF